MWEGLGEFAGLTGEGMGVGIASAGNGFGFVTSAYVRGVAVELVGLSGWLVGRGGDVDLVPV